MMQFEKPVAEWFTGQYAEIPEHMRDALVRYVVDRVKPGNFLTAVICNDLSGAVMRADEENLPLLKTYVQWFYNVPPASCTGSQEAMVRWLEHKTDEECKRDDDVRDFMQLLNKSLAEARPVAG
jgi:hypothetical protein